MFVSASRYRTAKELKHEMQHARRKMTKEEKEEAQLEEKWSAFLRRYCARPMFLLEIVNLVSLLLVCVKCLSRLFVGEDPDTAEWAWWICHSHSHTPGK